MRPALLLASLMLLAGPRTLAAALPLAGCRPEGAGEDVLCGTLPVPEDRAHPAARTIALHVVVLPALDAHAVGDPIFYLEGGPGMPATGAVDLFTGPLRDYRAHRAVVLVDQRGTGGSNGLDCRHEGGPLARALASTFPLDYVRRCRADAERHADLRFYTSRSPPRTSTRCAPRSATRASSCSVSPTARGWRRCSRARIPIA